MRPGPAFCTIIAKNYLAYARVLTRSLLRQHPELAVYVALVDGVEGRFDPSREPFELITLDELRLPNPRDLCFRYDVLELSTAVKPFLLRVLFDRGHDKVVFLDPDIRVYRPLDAILGLLDSASVVLTPHLTGPIQDDGKPGEKDILRVGVYNLGFIGLSAGEEADQLLRWWAERCETDCVSDPDRGLFVDQRWIDLATGLFDRVHVFRNPAYNVAHWNLGHRRLEGSAVEPRVNGEPLVFFHFSGIEPLKPTRLSRHADRHSPIRGEPLTGLVQAYTAELLAAGYRECAGWPYTYGTFSDGQPILREFRELYREHPRGRYPNPFRTDGTDSFLRWAVTPAANGRPARSAGLEREPRLAPLASRILARRPDLRAAFGNAAGPERTRFLHWLAGDGVQQHQLRPEWCAAWLATTEDAGPMRRLLRAYDAHPELQRRFPMAFVAEHDAAAFVDWLEGHAAEIGLANELTAIRQLVADGPVARLRSIIYETRPDVRRAFPDAFTWPGDPDFLAWLRDSGRREYGVPEDWVLWLDRARRQHICLRLHRLYSVRSEWRLHLDAFSPFGRGRFLAWLRQTQPEIAPELDGLTRLCAPEPTSALEELRRHYHSDAALQRRFPRAFERAVDTRGLLAWTQEQAGALGLARTWLDALDAEMRSLGLADEGALVIGYLRAESGMGELVRATVRSLAAVGYPLGARALEDAPQRQADLTVSENPAEALPFAIVHANGPEAIRLHERLAPWLARRYAIGYWAWEIEALPGEWDAAFQMFDEVWTCSRFAATAIAARAPVPVHTIWPSVAEPITPPLGRQHFDLDPDAFTFLFLYDVLSESERKNPLGLLAAFRSAFRGDDRVRLVLKIANGDLDVTAARTVVEAAAGLPVTILDRYLSRSEVSALVAACDAYVSLHRAEGFGFPMAEAMALGKPVVATYYSGNVDYMTPWNCYPVPYRLVEIPRDYGPYRHGALWAEPDVEAAAAALRRLYDDPEAASAVGARGRDDVQRQLSSAVCGQRIAERLRAVARGGKRR